MWTNISCCYGTAAFSVFSTSSTQYWSTRSIEPAPTALKNTHTRCSNSENADAVVGAHSDSTDRRENKNAPPAEARAIERPAAATHRLRIMLKSVWTVGTRTCIHTLWIVATGRKKEEQLEDCLTLLILIYGRKWSQRGIYDALIVLTESQQAYWHLHSP